MRFGALIALAFVFVQCSAQSALDSAKPDLKLPDVSSKAGASTDLLPLLQLVLAVGVVVWLLKWLLPKFVVRMSKKLTTPLGSQIRIEQSATFGAGTLYIVEVDETKLLICSSSNGVTALADLSSQNTTNPKQEPFVEVLRNASEMPSAALFRGATNCEQPAQSIEEKDSIDAQEALKRLSRLVS